MSVAEPTWSGDEQQTWSKAFSHFLAIKYYIHFFSSYQLRIRWKKDKEKGGNNPSGHQIFLTNKNFFLNDPEFYGSCSNTPSNVRYTYNE